MFRPIRSHPYLSAVVGSGVVVGLAWLAFGYFGVHTLFVDDVVSEAAPVFEATTPPPAESPSTVLSNAPSPVPAAEITPTRSAESPPDPDAEPEPNDEPTEQDIVVEFEGSFMGESRYSTEGRAVVLGNGTGQRFLRFEDFETNNGPDLNVYLVDSSAGGVSDFVDLGDLKGNIGDQNYEIPPEVDLASYDRVVIWCVRFGVGFGSASLEMV